MFLPWDGVISQKSTENLEVVSSGWKGVFQGNTILSILRGQRKQGLCFEVVEVAGIGGVRDKWSRCSKQALAETPGSMEYLMIAVRGMLSYAESSRDS